MVWGQVTKNTPPIVDIVFKDKGEALSKAPEQRFITSILLSARYRSCDDPKNQNLLPW
ncbi:hypothetical protein BDZ94DRAFT_1256371 [Collybia nuda]|uniref:Uncharacterized protein n=1 Tax=Collybia nuda TaxID=64659 RepID=A0A9P6CFQ9_9AGAR|nr:hypothetical protein BDZ94DRAFT_1256371 [Collybia nuda]